MSTVASGQNQQVQQVLQDNDNAIGYMALAFSGSGIQAIGIEFEGTLFEPDADAENTIFDSEYPLNRDLHMYTRINEDTPEGTDMREAAFLNMFLTEFGQQTFVEDVNYITLPTSDIEAEREKLPTRRNSSVARTLASRPDPIICHFTPNRLAR